MFRSFYCHDNLVACEYTKIFIHIPGEQNEEHEGNFEDLGANSTDTRNGIVVPEYMDIEAIEELEPAE